MGSTHWLDSIAQELWSDLHERVVPTMKEQYRGDVPLGTVKMSMDEQLNLFMNYQPQELEAIRQQVGDEEFSNYVNQMGMLMKKRLGPFANIVRQTIFPDNTVEQENI